MDMKKIALAVLVVAVYMTAAYAAGHEKAAAASGPSAAAAPDHSASVAPGPSGSGSTANMPVFGSLVGASLLSILAFYMH